VQLTFSAERRPERIDFVFTLTARQASKAEHIVIPDLKPAKKRARKDELWKHTCLEVFIGAEESARGRASYSGREYVEVNLSPSGDWNAYGFTDYRAGMTPVEPFTAPEFSMDASPYDTSIQWRGAVDASRARSPLTDLLDCPTLVLGATAVLEYENGNHEYWALTHAGAKPDFHLRESFSLRLNSSGAPSP
jgi:hypothetical protein